MAAEESIERLLGIFQDLKKNFEGHPSAWEEHITEAELSCLKELISDQRNFLSDCVADIDQQILVCVLLVEDYLRACRILAMLSERTSRLGTELVPLPPALPAGSVADIIVSRIQYLKSQGRL